MHRPIVLGASVVTALALGLTGCAPAEDGTGAASPSAAGSGSGLSGALTVYAAASLAAAFDELSTMFEERHPSVDVRPIAYEGSSTLATQLVEGAPADVFAAADERSMTRVVDEGLADDPRVFATNTLVLVVPAGNPAGIRGLDDLADPAATIVLCAAEVPCGAASATLLSSAGVEASADSYEQNVTAVLTKVAAGEADAGLVYATDASTTAAVDAIEPEGADDVVNRYPVAALAGAANAAAADAFVAFVLGDDAQAVLADHGFGAP